jgi:hypothetical protein
MENKDLKKITADIKKQYPDAGIKSIEVDERSGKSTFYLSPAHKTLAYLENGGVVPKAFKEKASIISRDTLDRTFLDLTTKDPMQMTPTEIFKKAIDYYNTDPLVGSTTNILVNLANKGFEHDIDDDNIKNFFDVWAFDVGFHEFLEWAYLDFFKTGHVTTYKVLGKYEPRVSYLSPIPGQKIKTSKTATGAKKNIWSKSHLPMSYTVLNPTLVNIEGNLLFDKVSVKLTPPTELKELLSKEKSLLTEEEKELIKALPSELKRTVEKGGEIQLDSRLVGSITYRKMPYERYAKPRSFRLFDTIEYKRSLKQADLSTLDGITNYILKITIGNDEYPVVTQEELEAASQLFNTSSKSFDVVWNHTLKVEKIVSPEIGEILGKSKYEQVNDDMTGGLSMSRAFIDGGGDLSDAEAGLLVKGIQEEIEYARRQVTKWIYREYQQIAEVMGFDRFPRIRWDEGVLKDTIMYMNIISQLVDRRMLSYRTSLEALGFDYPNELSNMEAELPLVEDGVFGILGSPWQQSKIQPVQNAPAGTPSNGRPTNQPTTKKTKQAPNKKNTTQLKKKTKPQKTASVADAVKDMTDSEFVDFQYELNKLRIENEED